ncbi:hypothetical protein [Thiobacillus sp.]
MRPAKRVSSPNRSASGITLARVGMAASRTPASPGSVSGRPTPARRHLRAGHQRQLLLGGVGGYESRSRTSGTAILTRATRIPAFCAPVE